MAGDEVDGTVAPGAATLFADPLALEAQVCFALSAGARGMVALYRPLLEPLGITHPQYLVLLALWQDDAAGESKRTLHELHRRRDIRHGEVRVDRLHPGSQPAAGPRAPHGMAVRCDTADFRSRDATAAPGRGAGASRRGWP